MTSGTLTREVTFIYTAVTEHKLLGPNVLRCPFSSLDAISVSMNLERMRFRPFVQKFEVATRVVVVEFGYEKVTFFMPLKTNRRRIGSAHH